MRTVINTSVGQNKGAPRIWLEGLSLEKAGVGIGMRYERTAKTGQLMLKFSDEGRYKVSRKKKSGLTVPVIDINSSAINEVLGDIDIVKVQIGDGVIIITGHVLRTKIQRREHRFLNRLKNKQSLAKLSGFAGGGIMDRALHEGLSDLGVKSHIKYAIELEDKYLSANLSINAALYRDDTVFIHSDICLATGEVVEEVDLCSFGIPCVGASVSGRAKNGISMAEEHPQAGHLFYSTLSIIEAANPAVVQIENVASYQTTASMVVIRSVLEGLGYKLFEKVLEGNEFGSLEDRKRLVFIGVSEGLIDDTEFFDDLPVVSLKPNSLSAIMDEVAEDDPRWKDYQYLKSKEKRDRAAGKGFMMQELDGSESKCGTIGKGYQKVRSTEPRFLHPTDDSLSRLLTRFEHAKVKTVPIEMVLHLNDAVSHEILGNGVIFDVFRSVGRRLAFLSLRAAFSDKVCFYRADDVIQGNYWNSVIPELMEHSEIIDNADESVYVIDRNCISLH